MEIFLGADHCITPLGSDTASTFKAMEGGGIGIHPQRFPFAELPVPVGVIEEEFPGEGSRVCGMIRAAVLGSEARNTTSIHRDPRTAWILATTKGDIKALENGNAEAATLPVLARHVQRMFDLPEVPQVLSSACISGTLAIQFGAELIRSGSYDHAVVVAVDEVSEFVLSGFNALHAMSFQGCRPFDDARDGITLGEAVACMVLSRSSSIFDEPIGTYLGGGMGNDANHISGPSRTGEGLVHAIQRALENSDMRPHGIAHINAHGTGSSYNDTMEAIAFARCGLSAVPLNSYKGYFGHTLGTAGTVESMIALHGLKEGMLLRNMGISSNNDLPQVNVLHNNTGTEGRILLKTSSGFGGCNAAVVLKAWTR